jgi:hypothetical protein
MTQHDILIRGLEKVAGDSEGENGGWKIKLITFVGGTGGSVHVQTLNDNLKELQVIDGSRDQALTLESTPGLGCPGRPSESFLI